MTIKNLILSVALVLIPALAGAQSWIDITDDYVKNPHFDNNTVSGWTCNYTGNFNLGYEAAEVWNGTFNVSQTLNVPNGKYRISVQAFYREGGNDTSYSNFENGTDNVTGFLFANNDKQALANIYTEWSSTSISGTWTPGASKYFPDNMYSASQFFSAGRYWNSIETEVKDNTLKFGLICEKQGNSSWCMFDNFKLECYGVETKVTGITLSSTSLSLVVGETSRLTASVLPENATYRNVAWESSNAAVASVDQQGNITAIKNGTATITVRSIPYPSISKSCTVTVSSNTAGISQLMINEIQSCNIDMYMDKTFNYGGWIELYNPTDKTVSLAGLHLSDDIFNLTKHKLSSANGIILAKGYKVVWFDRREMNAAHVSFKLDYDGGSIFLSDKDGNIITVQDYPVGIPRTSYARTTDGGDTWSHTAQPTPGKSNATSEFASVRLDAPVVDKNAGLFTSAFNVRVTIPEGATLRYTTNGSTPTLTNGNTSTTGLFSVSATTTYRFRLFKSGMLPSQVVTRSYIKKDKAYKFPIISITTDRAHLYDDQIGVYVRGTNGRPGNGQSSPCNWNMDWDRPVNFEYICPDGTVAINQEVDFYMCGGWTRSREPHSFKVKAEKIYEGVNYYEYPLFANKPYLKHKVLQVRNGGNDNDSRIKDAALQEIVRTSGLYVEGQSYQPIHNFINGQYIGMLNMREPNNKFYAYANYGYDTKEMDQFEIGPDSGYTQTEGTRDAFVQLYKLTANAAKADTYAQICELLDVDEYANYMAVQMYIGNTDWPQNNVKGFKSRLEGGKFRFVLYDLDNAFKTSTPLSAFEGKKIYTFNELYPSHTKITEEIEFVTIFLNLLKNDTFRKKFIDSFCLVAGSVFAPDRCNEIIEALAANTKDVLSWEGKNPYNTANSLKSSLANRRATLINHLKNYQAMKLSNVTTQQVTLATNVSEADIMVNNMLVPTNKFNGSLFAPITLKASAPAGYRFVGWRGTGGSSSTSAIISAGSQWKYYDKGSLATSWRSTSYADSQWQTGNAPLGYAKDGVKTTLNYGTDASNKRPTYYFRKTFTLNSAPTNDETLQFNFTIDDGLIVYVNGTEAGRYNMPSGTVTYSTFATAYAQGNPDTGTLTLDPKLFVKGTNCIAVEIHNNSASSTDIYFDASLSRATTSYTYISTNAEYKLPTTGSHNLTACFERISDEELAQNKVTPVKINELSAANSIFLNDLYKKNDWIELYNTTDKAIDIAGMYVSDNLEKPLKWQVPSSSTTGISTTIQPHSYLVIWADKLDAVSQLHASFKLAAEGGEVLITAADQSWSDTLYYSEHYGEQSVGLYPDGSNTVYIMDKPTIASSNVINSYATIFKEPTTPSGIRDIELASDDNLLLRFDGNNIVICSANEGQAHMRVNTMAGQTWTSHTLLLNANAEESVSLATLPRGIYLVSVKDAKGNSQTIKIMKR